MKDKALFNIIEELRNWSQGKGSLVRLCSLLSLDYDKVEKSLFGGGITDAYGQILPAIESMFAREAFIFIMLYQRAFLQSEASMKK